MPAVPARQISQVIDTLRVAGTLSATELAGLSDLSREEVAAVRAMWHEVAPEERESLLTRAQELADDNTDIHFERFAAIGLDDSVAAVRRAAAQALWEVEDRTAIERLAVLVRNDPDEGVRGASAAALRASVVRTEFEALDPKRADAVIDALQAAARDENEAIGVRAASIESLGARSLPWVSTLINDAYYAEDDRMRIAAIRAMGHSADERWVEFLADQAVSDDPEFRFEAAQSLGEIASEDGVAPLTGLLDDEDLEVVAAALLALGEIGGEDVIVLLKHLTEHPPEGLEEEVDAALEMAKFVTLEGGVGRE